MSSLEELEKERWRNRQAKMSNRRKESGLTAKRLQLTKYDLERIGQLAEHLGYDEQKLKLEEISDILGYCLAVTCKHENIEDRTPTRNSKELLYRYKIRLIIKHRLRIEKKAKDKYQRVAEFMAASKYHLPSLSDKRLLSIPDEQHDEWSEAWIKVLSE